MRKNMIALSLLTILVAPALVFAQEKPQECTKGVKESFAVYLAKAADREGQPPLTENDADNFEIVGKLPVITGAEVESLKTQDEPDSDRLRLFVTLTKAGARKIKNVTTKNLGKDLLFEIGQEIVSHPRIAEGIKSNNFVISMAPGSNASDLLSRLCK